MAGPWELLRRAAELNEQEDEAARVASLEEAVAESRRLDALLDEHVERLERALVVLLERAADAEERHSGDRERTTRL